MGRIAYDSAAASAFAATRHLADDGLTAWRAAVASHLRSGMRILDVGAGTGRWARAFTGWFPGIEVVAVEPAQPMRSRAEFTPMLAGDAANLPLADRTADAAWISTVIHHVPDLAAAARELRRVLRPGAPVLIRSVFAGRHQGISLVRWFPEVARVLDTYPSITEVETAFATAGFTTAALDQIAQVSAPSLAEAAAQLRREAHTPLQLLTDGEYARGLTRLHTAAQTEPGPVIDTMDLLVLR